MESLPDELILLIFRYLHKFDIFYSFNHLNRRFQRIIKPYQYEIDLTRENTYKHFQFFLKRILPLQEEAVRNLKLDGKQVFQTLYPHIRHLTNLETLTLKLDITHTTDTDEQQDYFVTEVISLPFLSELSILVRENRTLKTISLFALPNLTTLTLLHPNGFPNLSGVSKMPYLKRLSINILSIKALAKLFSIMTNLEELYLSIVSPVYTRFLYQLEVPKTLHKLHLELNGYEGNKNALSLHNMKKFLKVFKDNLTLMTLIIIDVGKEFSKFDAFHSLVSNFTRLKTFEYCIRTKYQPDSLFTNVQQLPDPSYVIFTLPQPQSFNYTSRRTRIDLVLDSNITLQQLFNCTTLCLQSYFSPKALSVTSEVINNLKFVYLTRIRIYNRIEGSQILGMCQFLSKLINLSPNLNTVAISGYTNDTTTLIQQLKERISLRQLNKFTHLELSARDYHSSFFYNLSKTFSNLITLTLLPAAQFFDENPTTLINFVQMLSKYFPTLLLFLNKKNINSFQFGNGYQNANYSF